MLTVTVRANEPFEKAVRRFETECKKAGIIQIAKRKMYYIKPSRKRYLEKISKRNNNSRN